ncbi:hypothetical protein [Homoserinibacter sp. YIM 151385]|uniref:hypothetical protein n=1 Tax=Homoserinibacter sp. YIM 151385 TaxID=2985506 RepID=UPI0022F0DD47|nr:hypothetical protein [Homoserinibacter sp. YIM 151385]WBU39005.1 hypothetical protein OF852_05340 [Homoserinibacter sp. YIM 151385]
MTAAAMPSRTMTAGRATQGRSTEGIWRLTERLGLSLVAWSRARAEARATSHERQMRAIATEAALDRRARALAGELPPLR